MVDHRNIMVGGLAIALSLSIAFSGGALGATWIGVELEITPQTCGPSSIVSIQGMAFIDGDPGTPAKGADVGIRINNTAGYLDEYNITADADGHFSISITAPSIPGNYTVNVTVVKTLIGWNESTLIILTPSPDLKFKGNITFSNQSPKEGEQVTISCCVENTGKVWCEANVSFYDGNPIPKGQLIEIKNFSLGAEENITISISWNTIPGIHKLYAIISDCTPQEHNLSNNELFALIDVADTTPPHILSIYSNPLVPTSKDNVTIFVLVEDNLGIAKQDGVLLEFDSGASTHVNLNMTNADSNLYSASIGINPAETVINYSITTTDQYGNINRSEVYNLTISFYEICIQLINPSQEYEKESFVWVNGSAMLDGYYPLKGGDVTVTTNAGFSHWTSMTDDHGNFAVKITAPETEGTNTATVAVSTDDYHNSSIMNITVLGDAPDMQITIDDVSILPTVPEEGEPLTVTVTVTNIGQIDSWARISLYKGNPSTGGVSVDVSDVFVPAENSNTTTLEWLAEPGAQSLWLIVSSNITERNLSNNAVEKAITVSTAPSQDNQTSVLLILTNIISLVIIAILTILLKKKKITSWKREPDGMEKFEESDEYEYEK